MKREEKATWTEEYQQQKKFSKTVSMYLMLNLTLNGMDGITITPPTKNKNQHDFNFILQTSGLPQLCSLYWEKAIPNEIQRQGEKKQKIENSFETSFWVNLNFKSVLETFLFCCLPIVNRMKSNPFTKGARYLNYFPRRELILIRVFCVTKMFDSFLLCFTIEPHANDICIIFLSYCAMWRVSSAALWDCMLCRHMNDDSAYTQCEEGCVLCCLT